MLLIEALDKALPQKKLHSFYTFNLGFLLYTLITTSGSLRYMEVGVGFGATALVALLGLKENSNKLGLPYRGYGIEKRPNRAARAKNMFAEYGVDMALDVTTWQKVAPGEEFDVLFADAGNDDNQQVIDKFGANVSKFILAHDVDRKLVFPPGFKVIYLPPSKACLAIRYAE